MNLRMQEIFMRASGQTVGKPNRDQLRLYANLIQEELDELYAAMADGYDRVEMLDAITDLLVVVIGAGLSEFTWAQLEAAWDEVAGSNLSKIDPHTCHVEKREDGKVLKGENYFAPNLKPIIEQEAV